MNWFKHSGWSCLPVTPEGFFITVLAVVFMLPVCMTVFRNSHSVTASLYQILVYGTCTAFWRKWVAEKTSADAA